MLNKLKTSLKAAGVMALAFVSSQAMAISEAQQAEVTQAFADGGVSLGIVVSGVILLAATLTGLGLIYSWLKK